MLVRYDYIENFFEKDTFTNVDLENLRLNVENKGYNSTERKAAMSLIEMHLAAYAMGTSLQKPKEEKKPVTKHKQKLSNRKSRKKDKRGELKKISNPKKLTSKLRKVLNEISKNKSLKYKKQKSNNTKGVTKQISRKRVEDKQTLEIREMLKKRGVDEESVKHESTQKYRGSVKTPLRIIYTRM